MSKLKLWRIFQTVNSGYDTYDSAVVCAPDEESARRTEIGYGWVHFDSVKAEYLGEARDGMPVGVIVASFNAG